MGKGLEGNLYPLLNIKRSLSRRLVAPSVATMTWQLTPYAAIMIASMAISAGVALVAWRQRRVAGENLSRS